MRSSVSFPYGAYDDDVSCPAKAGEIGFLPLLSSKYGGVGIPRAVCPYSHWPVSRPVHLMAGVTGFQSCLSQT